jgi:hypothetical protein
MEPWAIERFNMPRLCGQRTALSDTAAQYDQLTPIA